MHRARAILSMTVCCSLLCTLLSGCAATTRKGQEQAKGTAVGAGVGAVVGGVVGGLLGGRRGILVGAGIGALVGGAAGYAYATHTYEKIEQAANKADQIDRATAQTANDIAKQQQVLCALSDANRQMDDETTCLARDYANRKIAAEVLQARKAEFDNKLVDARNALAMGQKEQAYLQDTARPAIGKYGTPEQVKQLEDQIATVQKQNAQLEKTVEERASFSERLTTG